ncbi:MAG: hypothetical protein WBA57_13335 [Elainellaceae cyanobacterium]
MWVNEPLLWLGISTALLAVSTTAVVVVAIPVILKLSKTAQSADRLLETLNQELPATLDALRSTGQELSDLTGDLGDSVESAKSIVQRVDQSMSYAGQQLQQAQITSKSAIAGFRTAWAALFPSNERQVSSKPVGQENLNPPLPQQPSISATSPSFEPSNGVDSDDPESAIAPSDTSSDLKHHNAQRQPSPDTPMQSLNQD